MNHTINILLLEDNDDDAELIQLVLKRASIGGKFIVASDLEVFKDIIQKNLFNIVLSDYNLGYSDALQALKICRNFQIPFIVVSGMLPVQAESELAVQGISYVRKEKLSALPGTILMLLGLSDKKIVSG